jgi:hypothetical protein
MAGSPPLECTAARVDRRLLSWRVSVPITDDTALDERLETRQVIPF